MLFTDILKFLCSKAFLLCLAVITALMFISGCSSLASLGDKSADRIAPLIDKYCEETSEQVRLELREKINARTNGNEVEIRCNSGRG